MHNPEVEIDLPLEPKPVFKPGDKVAVDPATIRDIEKDSYFKPLFREGTVKETLTNPMVPEVVVVVGIKAVPHNQPAARPEVYSFIVPAKSLTRVPDREPQPPTS